MRAAIAWRAARLARLVAAESPERQAAGERTEADWLERADDTLAQELAEIDRRAAILELTLTLVQSASGSKPAHFHADGQIYEGED